MTLKLTPPFRSPAAEAVAITAVVIIVIAGIVPTKRENLPRRQQADRPLLQLHQQLRQCVDVIVLFSSWGRDCTAR